jgi:putative CocE/NonD family hydrolase
MAAPTKFFFTYAGSKCGESKFERFADGRFESSMSFVIGPQSQAMTLKGKFEKDLLTEFDMNAKAGSRITVVTLKEGKLNATVDGKVQGKEVALKVTTPALLGAFIPEFTSTLFAEWKKDPTKKKFDVFFIDSLAPMSVDVVNKPMTAVLASGTHALTMLTVTAAGIDIQYAFTAQGDLVGMQVPAQKFGAFKEGWEGVFTSPVMKYKELSQPIFEVAKESAVATPMRDGVKLISDVVRPKDELKHPVILIRTPYGRKASALEGEFWASRGYVLVAQDVRGRGSSEGEFDPLIAEVSDGKDTLDWLVSQPWCNGKVGMIGGSYLGYVQWAAASTQHPALKCIIPQVSPPNPMQNFPWDHGAFMLAPNVWWSRVVKDKEADMSSAMAAVTGTQHFLDLPITKIDDAMLGKNIPFYDDWTKRLQIGDWKGVFRAEDIGKVKIPVLHVSGTWDGDGVGTKIHWQALRTAGSKNQWMVFGPWTHFFNSTSEFGGFKYGPDAILELDSVYLRFFDSNLKGKDVFWNKQPHVRMFVTGANKWYTSNDWPLPQSKAKTLFLGGKTAVGPKSKGQLLAKVPRTAKDSYVYDPNNTKFRPQDLQVGKEGNLLMKAADMDKNDVAFASAPFTENTVVSGPLKLEVYVSTTAKDATFHVMVFDQYPNGDARLIGLPGTKRVWYELGKPGPIVPKKVYKITIEPWEFAHLIPKGHQLAIYLTSDMFPQFARNPGTGEPEWKATKLVKATHTVHWGKKYPSKISYFAFKP